MAALLPHQRKKISFLSDFVYFGGPSLAPVSKQIKGMVSFKSLADLAVREDWGLNLKILFNYMDRTFARVCQLDRQNGRVYLTYSSDMATACFHTGLCTEKWAPIYCLLGRATGYDATNDASREYSFWVFIVERDLKNKGLFTKLPPPPSYYDNPYECFYDYRVPIHENVDHIMSDEHKQRVIEAFPKFADFSENVQEALLRDAIEMAKLRCASNIRTVVPQYYRHKIQLLMPLSMDGQVRVVLVLEKRQNVANDQADHAKPEDWFYDASTILSLDMAYNNARLIFRIESEWLNASETREDEEEERKLLEEDKEDEEEEGDEDAKEDKEDEDDDGVRVRIVPLRGGRGGRGGWGLGGWGLGGRGGGAVGGNLPYCKFCKKSDAHPRNQCPDFKAEK